jgi:hypothetical protein
LSLSDLLDKDFDALPRLPPVANTPTTPVSLIDESTLPPTALPPTPVDALLDSIVRQPVPADETNLETLVPAGNLDVVSPPTEVLTNPEPSSQLIWGALLTMALIIFSRSHALTPILKPARS